MIFLLFFASPALALPPFTASGPCAQPPCEIRLTPAPGLHFNGKAPWKLALAAPAKLEPRAIKATVTAAERAGFAARVFVCDEKETYCREENARLTWENGAWRITEGAASLKAAATAPGAPVHGFSRESLPAAIAAASAGAPNFLVDFSAVWCPACLRLEDEVLSRPAFQKLSRRYRKIRVDADDPGARAEMDRYHVLDMPTLLVLNPSGEELARFHGFRPLSQVTAEFRALEKNPPTPLPKLRAAADAGDRAARDQVGRAEFQALRMEEAVKYLAGSHQEKERWLLARASLAEKNDEKKPLLRELTASFPNSVDAPTWYLALATLEPEGSAARKDAAESARRAAAVFLAHPARLKNEQSLDPDRDDVALAPYQYAAAQAEAFGYLGKTAEAQAAWEEAIRGVEAAQTGPGQGLILARYLGNAGRGAEIPPLLEKLAKASPENYVFPYKLGKLALQAKDLAAAETHALRARELAFGSNRYATGLLLAQVYQARGKADEQKQTAAATLKLMEPRDILETHNAHEVSELRKLAN